MLARFRSRKADKNKAAKTQELKQLLNSPTFTIAAAMALIAAGADPNTEGDDEDTLLHRLVESGDNNAVIEQLVRDYKATASIYKKGHKKLTPFQKLMNAEAFFVDTAMTLVSLGTNVHATDRHKNSILHRVVRANKNRNHDAAIETLLKKYKFDINIPGQEGRPPLHTVIALHPYPDKLSFIQWLMDKGAKLNIKDKSGRTDLHWAAGSGDLALAQWLVNEKKADAEAPTLFGNTPLHFSCFNGYVDFAQWLVKEKKANIHAKTSVGTTPLFSACYYRQLNLAKWLVTAGASLKDTNDKNQTLLHAAVIHNDLKPPSLEMISWLVDSGEIDIDAVDSDQHTIFTINPNLDDKIKVYLQRAQERKRLTEAATIDMNAKASPKQDLLPIFIEKHKMSLENSGIFKAIKKFFSKMWDLLWNNPQKPIKTIADVKQYATDNPGSRTAHILKVMNSRMTVQEFKDEYEAARNQQFFSNPFETRMRDLLKTLNTPQALADCDMEAIKDHAINRPDSLTAQIITRSSPRL